MDYIFKLEYELKKLSLNLREHFFFFWLKSIRFYQIEVTLKGKNI